MCNKEREPVGPLSFPYTLVKRLLYAFYALVIVGAERLPVRGRGGNGADTRVHIGAYNDDDRLGVSYDLYHHVDRPGADASLLSYST